MPNSCSGFSIPVKAVGCRKLEQEYKDVTLIEAIFTRGPENEVDAEASMISRWKCKLGKLRSGKMNGSKYAFSLLQLGNG